MGAGRFNLNRMLLIFKDAEVERDFSARSFATSIVFIRIYLIAAVVLYSMFGLLDALIGDRYLQTLWAIRYLFAVPIMVIVLALSYTKSFERYVQPALTAAMGAGGLGVLLMVAVLPAPFNSQYYAGLIMVVIYSGSLLGLRFSYSLFVTLSIVACYQVVSLYVNPIPTSDYVSNNFFLTMATGVGLFCSYILETQIRNNYIAQKIIEEKNVAVQALLDEAEAANKAKSEFLATMSHELRTPLNAIIGFSEMIRQEYLGPVGTRKYVEYATDINDSGQHLLSIISDILDLAKAESGKLELNETRFDIAGVVQSTLKMFQQKADESRISLDYRAQTNGLEILGDERLIRQVGLNLISNAMKFTPGHGRVSISVDVNETCGITIRVKDTGIGIATENLERVLRPFEQVESSLARSHGGTGLGLPYSKKIVEVHGGSLTLESALNQGTVVTVRLPMSRVVNTTSQQPRDNELQAAG